MSPCYGSIQAAVDAAAPGDEIRVAMGTYTDVHMRPRNDITTTGVVTQIVYINKTIIIRGGYATTNWAMPYPATQPTVLNALRQGRVLYITGDISPTIENLSITGGDAKGLGGDPSGYDVGGGVFVITAAATLGNNQVFNNAITSCCGRGGGLYLKQSAAVVYGNTISTNIANRTGGGLYLEDSPARLDGNTIRANTVITNGGGLYLFRSNATLSNNIIVGNVADWFGGGAFLNYSDAILNSNMITSNTTGRSGGGLYLMYGAAILNANTIFSNAANYAGGVMLDRDMTTLSSNIVTANTAKYWGGGLTLLTSAATLINNIVSDNQAGEEGSGLSVQGGHSHLLHTTIARNKGGDGSGVCVNDPFGLYYSTVSMTNTILVSHTVGIRVTGGNTVTVNGILWHNTPVTASLASTAMVMVQNERVGDPAFAADGYRLTANSAAIDKGVDAGVTTDIDGQARPYGAAPDLGADEYVIAPPSSVTIAGPTTGAINTAYAFTATVSPVSATTPITYVWQATGQSPVTHTGGGTSDTTTFIWTSGMSGAQAITVTATNGAGQVNGYYTITISIPPPVAGFAAAPTSGPRPLTVVFTNTSTGDYDESQWSFGDGAFSVAQNPTHTYTAAGVYTVALTVNKLTGTAILPGDTSTLTRTNYIIVTEPIPIDPATGGTLVYTNPQGTVTTVITVPANAVSQTVTLAYTPVETATAPSDLAFAGHAFDLNVYQGDTLLPGFVFSTPITVALYYSEADVAGLDENSLKLYYLDGDTWRDAACGAYERHPDQDWLSVPICHLSQFALFGSSGHKVYLPVVLR